MAISPLHHVTTSTLDIEYEAAGDPAGSPVILLHGFPYDVRAYDEVAPPLAEAGLPGPRAVPARLRRDALP